MLRAVLLSRPKPPQAGAEGQPLQGHSSQPKLSTKVSGPPLPLPQPLAVGPNRPPRRAKFTHSKFKRAPLMAYTMMDAMKRNPRPLVDSKARERNRSRPAHLPAARSAAQTCQDPRSHV